MQLVGRRQPAGGNQTRRYRRDMTGQDFSIRFRAENSGGGAEKNCRTKDGCRSEFHV
jgi:hypothetical protein